MIAYRGPLLSLQQLVINVSRCVTRGGGGVGGREEVGYTIAKKGTTREFSFNICPSIFFAYIHERGETAVSRARVYSDVTREDVPFSRPVMRRTLEITSHLLTYRERIYARIHFGAYVHTGGTTDRNIRIRIREISGSFRRSPDRWILFCCKKFKRH